MSQSKKELLLHAALRLFNAYGFHGTATAKISKEAGVSTGTLYNYFDSKEALIKELFIYIKTNLFTYIMDSIVNNDKIDNTLEHLWAGMIKWAVMNPEYYKYKEAFYKSPYAEAIPKAEVMEIYKPLVEIIKKAYPNVDLMDSKYALLVEYFEASISATINYIRDYDVEDRDRAISEGFKMLWQGIETSLTK